MARKTRKYIVDNFAGEIITEPIAYKAAVYIRLSVENNKNRGDSLETQKRIIENFIALNPDMKVYDTYIDNGNTGMTFARPAFDKMIKDIEEKNVNCVIVKDLSRLGRNVIDTGFYIEKYFPLNTVHFIAVNDNFDTNIPNSIDIILPLKNMMNEAYSLDISRKIKSQQHQSMKDGEYIGARALYGYMKSPENCHKLIIDEKTAPIVKQIFDWAYERVGYNLIVKRLNEQGIITPSKYAQSKGIINNKNLVGNGKWQTRTIHKILSCELYTGDMVQGKTQSIYHKQVKVDKENWIIVRDTHEPIVSHHVFETVKQYRIESANKHKVLEVIPYSPNIFKGKIFCGHCGISLHRTRSHNKNYVYRCIANDRIAKDVCKPVSIREKDLISEVLKKLHRQSQHMAEETKSTQNNIFVLRNKLKNLQSDISFHNQDIKNNQKFLKSLYENLIAKVITSKEYFSMKADYENTLSFSLSKIAEMQEYKKDLEMQSSYFNQFTNSITTIDNYTDVNSELVRKLIDKIFVYENKSIDVHFYFENAYKKFDEVLNHGQ